MAPFLVIEGNRRYRDKEFGAIPKYNWRKSDLIPFRPRVPRQPDDQPEE